MKILTILGSPRLKGNTASVLSNFERRINARFAVERVDLARRRVNGCFGCNACQATGWPGACTQQDEGPAILEQIVAADAEAFFSGTAENTVSTDETGDAPADTIAWVGSATNDCQGWTTTDGSFSAAQGNSTNPTGWLIAGSSGPCSLSRSIYCIDQDP